MLYQLTRKSSNMKTGPIPVSMTSAASCPTSCPFRDNGCYAQYSHLRMHWDKLTAGERGMPWKDFLKAIRALPEGQLWRHNQAGDLPGVGDRLDGRMLLSLAKANKDKRGFTYTHKPPTPDNLAFIRAAVRQGFTVNLSANSLEHADTLNHGLPLVAVVPRGTPPKGTTPGGKPYLVCPAQLRDDVTCESCGLCQNSHPNRPIIAFEAHGSGAKRIEATLL